MTKEDNANNEAVVIDDNVTDNTQEDNGSKGEPTEQDVVTNIIGGIEEILNKPQDDEEENQGKANSEEEDSKSEDKDTTEYEEVPPAIAIPFANAAKLAGWSEGDIRSYITTHPDSDLVSLTNLLPKQKSDEKVVKKPSETPKLDEALLKKLGLDEEGTGALKALLAPIISELESKGKELEDFKAKAEEESKTKEASQKAEIGVQRFHIADELFDVAAEQLKSLGKTKALPKLPNGDLSMDDPMVKNRESIFNHAYVLAESGNYSFRDAMKIAIDSYKGSTAEKEFKESFIKKVKTGEKRLSAKGQQTQQTKKYKDARTEGIAIIKQASQKHGVNLPA